MRRILALLMFAAAVAGAAVSCSDADHNHAAGEWNGVWSYGTPGFTAIYQRIIAQQCVSCHNSTSKQGNLAFGDPDETYTALVGRDPSNGRAKSAGMKLVAASNPDISLLFRKLHDEQAVLTTAGLGARMPLSGPLPPLYVEAVKQWIAAGAPRAGGTFPDASHMGDHGSVWTACTATTQAEMEKCFAAPKEPTKMVRLYTPPLTIPPKSDVMICSPLSFDVAADLRLKAAAGAQTRGGHHVAVYVSSAPDPNGKSHVCTDNDMQTLRFVLAAGGAGGVNLQLPDGVATRITKGSQIVIQSHYINDSDQPMVAMDAVDLVTTTEAESPTLADALAIIHGKFEVPVGAEKYQVVKNCAMDEAMDIYLLLGHTHEYGVEFIAEYLKGGTAEPQQLYYATDGKALRSNPDIVRFNPPKRVEKGDVFRIKCAWKNTTDHVLKWPEEMCVAFMYYGPSRGFLTCDTDEETPAPDAVNYCVNSANPGNSFGVGKFCTPDGNECKANPKARTCLAKFDPSSNYCSVLLCQSDDDCGPDANCFKEPRGSACRPNRCDAFR